MSATEDYHRRMLFQLKIMRAHGNDGWIPEDAHYFQVYGPKATTKDFKTVALKKA
jgi:hypothetical protein